MSETVRIHPILKEPVAEVKGRKKGKGHRTTVETWRWGGANQLCPNCGNETPPLARKQRNKVTGNTFGAMCLISCWPVCFLPFLIGGSDVIYLFCEKCGFLLGTYDRKTGKISPSCAIDSDGHAKRCACTSNA